MDSALAPLLALALLLAGCSDCPSADVESQAPSVRPPPPLDPPSVAGELAVSTLPLDALAPLGQESGMVNCMYIGVESAGLVAVAAGSMKLEWVAESPLTEALHIEASGAGSASGTGTSPLWLNWTAEGGGLQYLPFKVHVTLANDPGVAVRQATKFDVRLEADAPGLEAIQAGCP